jgi:hypothetical protein
LVEPGIGGERPRIYRGIALWEYLYECTVVFRWAGFFYTTVI